MSYRRAGETGPMKIEESPLKHPGIALSAVIASMDEWRGSVGNKFVEPVAGVAPLRERAREIQDIVKNNLARYEYPGEINFLDDFPLTTTGKLRRDDQPLRGPNRKESFL